MGNYLSCTLAKTPGGKGARVILPDGAVRQVTLPATAAELMMDAPGHFLAETRHARVGTRLEALHADEDLEMGAVYATFPMKRIGTKLAATDMARLAAAATREARRSAKVSAVGAAAAAAPEPAVTFVPAAEETPSPRARLDEMVDDAVAAEIGVLKHRLSSARSRRPNLETIHEENHLLCRR
ncbi:hypothetical protein D1007_39033 [Hordeum vulgare]|uniref:Predicted protein n=1 Tax=Hordeum vulgare subsp. vulgare TaxID=112509 RepID=F2E4A4_HORVV|nr:uncharacterized protein LOC123418516 [Hordeum vulgare subsp. vulgare]KAE8787070.1 hypothetical protein D1007_39033 [Hordeum vulgare]BAK02176.1 predicted protein [Hordeum vulgare subsp. vulgare]BAK05735.1 predicted protein [Hordeum vulgare subsp. vulgare]